MEKYLKQCGAKRSSEWTNINHSKIWSKFEEGDVVYQIWLEGYCVLRTSSTKTKFDFWQVLFPLGSGWRNVSGTNVCQDNTRSHVTLSNQQILIQPGLHVPTTHALLTWLCTFLLWSVFLFNFQNINLLIPHLKTNFSRSTI